MKVSEIVLALKIVTDSCTFAKNIMKKDKYHYNDFQKRKKVLFKDKSNVL